MSFIPFGDQNVSAGTMSNVVIYKKQVTVLTTAGTTNYLLFTTDAAMGLFCPTEVIFHVDDNGGNDQRQFTASIGFVGSAYTDICPSANRGTTTTTAALQLRNNKAVVFGVQNDTTYFAQATPSNTATAVYLQVTVPPAGQVIGTFFIIGYYTGMRV